jgi:hypothetical protein
VLVVPKSIATGGGRRGGRDCLLARVAIGIEYHARMARGSRWDWLEGVRREPMARALAREAGKAIAAELRAWPPAIRIDDPARAAQLAPLLGAGSPPPSEPALALAFALADDVLAREFDARDARQRDATQRLPPRDRALATALADYLVEWLLDLAERTESRLTRPVLREALADARAVLAGAARADEAAREERP